MNYLDENEFENIYQTDIGNISKIKDSKSKYNNKLIYQSGGTINGYCYKDYNNFKNNPDDVCYIAECEFDDSDLLVDYVNENKDKLIKKGGLSTTNSIKEEIRNNLEYEEYYYEYQKNGIVYTIQAKDFDNELINIIAEDVFESVDWQTTSGYIYEIDWEETISDYYRKKIKDDDLIMTNNTFSEGGEKEEHEL